MNENYILLGGVISEELFILSNEWKCMTNLLLALGTLAWRSAKKQRHWTEWPASLAEEVPSIFGGSTCRVTQKKERIICVLE